MHRTQPGTQLLWLAAALLGLSVSCAEKHSAHSSVPTMIDGDDPRPHLVTIAFQNRGDGPSTAHYTYNGREMGTYREGLRNVVRVLRSAEEPYVLILHEPGYSIADAGGNVDGLNARFAQALVGKRVVQYGLDIDTEVLVIYIGLASDGRGVFEINGQRGMRGDVHSAMDRCRVNNGVIVAVEQGRYKSAPLEETKGVDLVCGALEDYQNEYGIVRWLSLQDSKEWQYVLEEHASR